MSTIGRKPSALSFSTEETIHNALRPAEALALFSSLIAVTDIVRQRAIYDLVLRESAPLELRLRRWRRALSDIATPHSAGPLYLWDRIEEVVEHIDDMIWTIRVLEQRMTTEEVTRFLSQMQPFQVSIQCLSCGDFPELPTAHADRLSAIVEEVDRSVDCIYCGVVRTLQQLDAPQTGDRAISAVVTVRRSPEKSADYVQTMTNKLKCPVCTDDSIRPLMGTQRFAVYVETIQQQFTDLVAYSCTLGHVFLLMSIEAGCSVGETNHRLM